MAEFRRVDLQTAESVQLAAPKGDDELAVATRLRILLQLAVTIGGRTGRLNLCGSDRIAFAAPENSESCHAELRHHIQGAR